MIITETKDTVHCAISMARLRELSDPARYDLLTLIQQNNVCPGKFFKFDDTTDSFMALAHEPVKELRRGSNTWFTQFRELVLGEARGPLYQGIDTLGEVVKSVYSLEPYFELAPEPLVPPTSFRVTTAHCLDMANLAILEAFPLPVVNEWMGHLLAKFDYELAVRAGRPIQRIHQLSAAMQRFGLAGDAHQFVESFKGSYAPLTGLLADGLRKVARPEDILRLLVVLEFVKEKANQKIAVTRHPD